ncbi:MAG: hypothetical protein D3909_04570 [Candidatus Electrothrix sp. ATG1]|nr:hypothetical protein [Candidatus Electrothrix sp. ATG1]
MVPDRLSYRELFPRKYRYDEGELGRHLRRLFANPHSLSSRESRKLTDPYSWPMLGGKYQKWLRQNKTSTT